MVIQGMTELFNPTTPFLSARIMDIVFDGVPIDCSDPESFGAKAICTTLRGEKSVKTINDTHLAFSVLGGVSIHYNCCFLSLSHSLMLNDDDH
jgi:scavenger receptor class B, member 1